MLIDRSEHTPGAGSTKFWRSQGVDGVEFLKGRYRNFTYAPHSHDSYMVGLISQGAIEVADPRSCTVVSQGQVTLYNVDHLHWGRPIDTLGWTIFATYVPTDTLDRIARDIGLRRRGTLCFSESAVVNPGLASKIAALFLHPDTDHEGLTRGSLLFDVIAESLTCHSESSAPLPNTCFEHRAVTVARDYLEGNFSENISLDALAKECGIGRFWLIKAFKSHWGIPPYAYLTNVRVRHALGLLRDGQALAEVAFACGFSDQSHLTRMFKRSIGVTPGAFRSLQVAN